MLDADTTDILIALARIMKGSPVQSYRSSVENIFVEFKLHEAIFCLCVPELMTSKFVPFVVLLAFEGIPIPLTVSPHQPDILLY
jgi:hypothetical protein